MARSPTSATDGHPRPFAVLTDDVQAWLTGRERIEPWKFGGWVDELPLAQPMKPILRALCRHVSGFGVSTMAGSRIRFVSGFGKSVASAAGPKLEQSGYVRIVAGRMIRADGRETQGPSHFILKGPAGYGLSATAWRNLKALLPRGGISSGFLIPRGEISPDGHEVDLHHGGDSGSGPEADNPDWLDFPDPLDLCGLHCGDGKWIRSRR